MEEKKGTEKEGKRAGREGEEKERGRIQKAQYSTVQERSEVWGVEM